MNSKTVEQVRLWPKNMNDVFDFAVSHLARYNFAMASVEDKNVCDIACGAGYGSYYLSNSAKSVVGIDISIDAIDWAKKHFHNSKTAFYCADGSNNWPIDNAFDVITSFETLEHVRQPDIFLKQIDAHLSPNGTLFMSVPNGPRDKNRTDNPHHIHHFSADDLHNLISRYFDNPAFYSQAYKNDIRHYAAKLLRKTGLAKKQKYFLENFYLSQGLDHELKTWFIIANKKKGK